MDIGVGIWALTAILGPIPMVLAAIYYGILITGGFFMLINREQQRVIDEVEQNIPLVSVRWDGKTNTLLLIEWPALSSRAAMRRRRISCA